MRILMTAFEPFAGEKENPSQKILDALPDTMAGSTLFKRLLPTEFNASTDLIKNDLLTLQPDAVIHLGQAGGRTCLSIERIAINMIDASIPDNAGVQPIDQCIQSQGQAAYFSTLPNKQIIQAIQDQGIPAVISNTAGTYVCNQVLYQTLYDIDRLDLPTLAGFIHVPYLPSQVIGKPQVASMHLTDMVQGITIAIETIVTTIANQQEKHVKS